MTYENIPYKSFCWVLGTTSFRTAQLNLRIEEQLILLDAFKGGEMVLSEEERQRLERGTPRSDTELFAAQCVCVIIVALLAVKLFVL